LGVACIVGGRLAWGELYRRRVWRIERMAEEVSDAEGSRAAVRQDNKVCVCGSSKFGCWWMEEKERKGRKGVWDENKEPLVHGGGNG